MPGGCSEGIKSLTPPPPLPHGSTDTCFEVTNVIKAALNFQKVAIDTENKSFNFKINVPNCSFTTTLLLYALLILTTQ